MGAWREQQWTQLTTLGSECVERWWPSFRFWGQLIRTFLMQEYESEKKPKADSAVIRQTRMLVLKNEL